MMQLDDLAWDRERRFIKSRRLGAINGGEIFVQQFSSPPISLDSFVLMDLPRSAFNNVEEADMI
jgi:hypothetical protein